VNIIANMKIVETRRESDTMKYSSRFLLMEKMCIGLRLYSTLF